VGALAGLLTTAMALAMLPLFLIGALSPYLVHDLEVPVGLLGVVASVGFAVAAALSLAAAPAVARIGARRGLVTLFAVAAVVMAGIALAPGFGWLIAVVAVSGVGQALANPATNQLIAAQVPAPRRGAVIGLKQSGVQLGAFCAGVPLAAVASVAGWRAAVGLAAVVALAAGCWAWALRVDSPTTRPGLHRPSDVTTDARWLCVFSILLGAGISAVNTYLSLFANIQLGFPVPVAGGLVAVLGVAGMAGRIGWARLAGRTRSGALLAPLSAGAVAAALALAAAARFGPSWVWLGALGVGGFAVAANAVSMVTVVTRARPDQVGRDSAVVSAGFFTGFAIGPTLLGALAQDDGGRFERGWTVVAAEFLLAALLAWWWQRRVVV